MSHNIFSHDKLKKIVNDLLYNGPVNENGYDRYSDPNFHKKMFPGALPVCMLRKHVPIVNYEPYMYCEKTDGERCLILFFTHEEKRYALVVYRNWNHWSINLNVHDSVYNGTILDCELLCERFYIFDTLMVAGFHSKDWDLVKRLEEIQKFYERAYLPYLPRSNCTFKLYPKKMYHVSEFANTYRDLLNNSVVDGFIFTPINKPAVAGTNYNMFKFKFEHTIDFNLIRGKLYIGKKEYPMHPDGKLNGTFKSGVVECCYEDNAWRICRGRKDKTHENSQFVFDRTFELIKDNFTFEVLLELFGLPPHPADEWGPVPEELPNQILKSTNNDMNALASKMDEVL